MTPEEKSRLGRKSRRKGQNFERLIANELKKIWPNCRRGLQSRGGTKEVPDIEGIPGWYVECKHGITTYPKKALEQARVASDGRKPLAITRDNGGPILVTMDFEDFVFLHQRIEGLKDQIVELEDQKWLKTPFTKEETMKINASIDEESEDWE